MKTFFVGNRKYLYKEKDFDIYDVNIQKQIKEFDKNARGGAYSITIKDGKLHFALRRDE